MRELTEIINNIGKAVEDFVFSMYDNLWFWVILFVALLIFVMWGYSYLHKKDR